jgi:hypothetical protein
MAKLLNINNKIFNEQLITALKTLISITIKKKPIIPKSSQHELYTLKPYGAFAVLIEKLERLMPKKTISIITFNYDLAIDYALENKNINYGYYLIIAYLGTCLMDQVLI